VCKPHVPIFRKADRTAFGHLDDGHHLAAFGDEGSIGGARHFEGAPETHPLHGVHPSLHDQFVADGGGAAVIDLSADDHGEQLGLRYVGEAHADLVAEESAGDFDEAEVGNIVHDPGAIGVEEHDLDFGFKGGRFVMRVGHAFYIM
jgi:hypothetical protein